MPEYDVFLTVCVRVSAESEDAAESVAVELIANDAVDLVFVPQEVEEVME